MAFNPMDPGQDWNSYIGSIWESIFRELNLPKKGKIAEIAPGSINKIGRGLSSYHFGGAIYIVEPNKQSLDTITSEYEPLFGKSSTIPIQKPVGEATASLPPLAAVLSNHPFDDMIVGESLDGPAMFDDLFDNHYEGASIGKTRAYWTRLESEPGKLAKIKQKIVDDWVSLIDSTTPMLVVVSQYQSHFFKSNNLKLPDQQAYEVLQNLRELYSQSDISGSLVSLADSQLVEDSSRWLVLKNPTSF